MRSVYDNLNVSGLVALFNTAATALQVGSGVDTKGYNSAALRVLAAPVGAGIVVTNQVSVVALLEESADNVTFTAALDNTGTQIQCSPQATVTAVVASARIEGLGQQRLRYLRIRVKGGTPTAGVIVQAHTAVALLELGRAYNNPVNTTVSNT